MRTAHLTAITHSQDTAVPFPYARLIVGKRHCRVLISGSINSNATGIDIIPTDRTKIDSLRKYSDKKMLAIKCQKW